MHGLQADWVELHMHWNWTYFQFSTAWGRGRFPPPPWHSTTRDLEKLHGAVRLVGLPPGALNSITSVFIKKHFAVILQYAKDGLTIEQAVLYNAREEDKKHKERWAIIHAINAASHANPAQWDV